jgi:hypothetical protein
LLLSRFGILLSSFEWRVIYSRCCCYIIHSLLFYYCNIHVNWIRYLRHWVAFTYLFITFISLVYHLSHYHNFYRYHLFGGCVVWLLML